MDTGAQVQRRTGELPAEVNSFVGRREELAEIRELLAVGRLVTLTGPGGVGKSRLVLRAAAGLQRAFPHGVWLVELADLEDASLLDQFISRRLGLLQQTGDPRTELLDYVADRSLLLLLDNCEHLIAAVAVLTSELLKASPGLRVLATSRERLGIPGEHTLRVPPMALPDPERTWAPTSLASHEAVTLFADRAVAADPSFMVSEHNSRDVLRIVHRLDGLPLAIELASARLRTLSVHEVAERLSERYHLLTGGNRAGPKRHQTMRLCVEWSFDQCTAVEQMLWRRLSVFVGGFGLDAVEGVCGFGALDPDEVVDLIGGLLDKSIVTRVDSSEQSRFRLLESLREFGHERLVESGEVDEVRGRHLDWYAALADAAYEASVGEQQLRWWRRLDLELPNLRAAFELTMTDPDRATQSVGLARRLGIYRFVRGLHTESLDCLRRALARDPRPQVDRIYALRYAVSIALSSGELTLADEFRQQCAREAAGLGERAQMLAAYAEGLFLTTVGDLDPALDRLQLARTLASRVDDADSLLAALNGLMAAAGVRGDRELAESSYREMLAVCEPLGDVWNRSKVTRTFARTLLRVDSDRAVSLLKESLELALQVDDPHGVSSSLQVMGCVDIISGRAEHGVVLLGAADVIRHDYNAKPVPIPRYLADLTDADQRARELLGEAAYDKAFDRGRALRLEEAAAFALGRTIATTAKPDRPVGDLTPREAEVAALIAEGLTNKEIAARLVVSHRTARGHVENIFTKLGFNTRAQVATWYAERSASGAPS